MSDVAPKIDFKIVTPEGVIYESEIEKVTIPTKSGQITVLPNHAPLVSVLKAGELVVQKGEATLSMAVSGGIIEIRPEGQVYIIADTAERAESIDVERADQARKRAEELLKQKENVADVDFTRIQAAIEKELARMDVGRKYRKLK